MGNCDWNDEYPPPKKCGYVGTWTGGGSGGFGWGIPPIDVDDDHWRPPPIPEEYSWYCMATGGCVEFRDGDIDAGNAALGPFDSAVECGIACESSVRVVCNNKGRVHWNCETQFFGPGEVVPPHPDQYNDMAECLRDCPPNSTPPVEGWQCDVNLEAGGDPVCTYIIKGQGADNGSQLYVNEQQCKDICKKGRWECNEALHKCYWNANAPKAVTLAEQHKMICEFYCRPPAKSPGSPTTGDSCPYQICDMSLDPPACVTKFIDPTTHPRLNEDGEVIEAHKGLYKKVDTPNGPIFRMDCESDDMNSTISDLGGFPGSDQAAKDDCGENCPPPTPVTPPGGTPPVGGATPDSGSYVVCNKTTGTCNYGGSWRSDIDFPNDGSSENSPYYDSRGRWIAHSGNTTLRTRIAASFGGFPNTRAGREACELTCDTLVSPPTGGSAGAPSTPHTPQSGRYWYCNKASYTCVTAIWTEGRIKRDFPETSNPELYNNGTFCIDADQPQRIADLFGGVNDTGPASKDLCEKTCKNQSPTTPGSPSAPSAPSGPGIRGSYLICITKGDPCHQKWWYAENFPQTNPAYSWAYNSRGQWDASEEEMATFLGGFPDTEAGAIACAAACAKRGPTTDVGGTDVEDTEVRSGAWYECDPRFFNCYRVEWTEAEFLEEHGWGSYYNNRGKFIATDDQVRLDNAIDGGQPDTEAGKDLCEAYCNRVPGSPSTPGNTVGGDLDVWYCELDGDCAMETVSVGREISDPNWVVPDNERGQPGFWGEGAEYRCNAECPDPGPSAPSTPSTPNSDLFADRFNCATGGEGGCTSISYGSLGFGAAWENESDCIENCPKKPPIGNGNLPPGPSTTGGGFVSEPGGDDITDTGGGGPTTGGGGPGVGGGASGVGWICKSLGGRAEKCYSIKSTHPEYAGSFGSQGACKENCGGDETEEVPNAPTTPAGPGGGGGGGGGVTFVPGDGDTDDSDDPEEAVRWRCKIDGTCEAIDDHHAEWGWASLTQGECEATCVSSPRWLCKPDGHCEVVDHTHAWYYAGFSTALECYQFCYGKADSPVTGPDATDGGGDIEWGDGGDNVFWPPLPWSGPGGGIDPDCILDQTHIQWVCDEDTKTCKRVSVPINVTYFDDAISCLNHCNANLDIGVTTWRAGEFDNVTKEGLDNV